MIIEPRRKGGMKYVPSNVLNEIQNIKMQDKLLRDAEAFDRMVRYAQVGRETNNLSGKMFGFPLVKKKK